MYVYICIYSYMRKMKHENCRGSKSDTTSARVMHAQTDRIYIYTNAYNFVYI